MTHSTLRVARARPPFGLVGTIGLVLAVELGLGRHEVEFMHSYTYDWLVTGRAAREKVAGRGVLCFGDSLVKFGVVPRVLEARLGRPVYNLAVCGGQAPSSYFLLRRALETGARPEAVVVDFMPHLLDHGPLRNARQWPVLLSPREFAELAWSTRSGTFLASTALAALLPSVRARFEIRAVVLAVLEGKTASAPDAMTAYERNWALNQGAQLNPKAPAGPARFNLGRWEDFPRPWSCYRVNAAFVRKFLALAQTHQIQVYLLLPPVRDDVQARRERLGVDPRYQAFVRSLQREFGNLAVIDGRSAGYGRALFRDPLHLDRQGALALSVGLADVLGAGDRTGGQWLALGQPRPPRVDVALEDLDESRLAVRLGARRLRR
jgi:hypothetical protein